MGRLIYDLVINVSGDLIATALIVIVGFGLAVIAFWGPRRKLLRFFGVRPLKASLRIYASNLDIVPGGARDFRGTPRSYQGAAIPEYEFLAVEPVARLFYSRLLENFPVEWRERLEQRFWNLHNVRPILTLSPLNEQDIEFDNLISLGSSGYNVVTDYYERHHKMKIHFDVSDMQSPFKIRDGKRKGEAIPLTQGLDMSILEKIRDVNHGTVVFISAGWDINGTRGALQFLVNNWEPLERVFGDEEFAICLHFPHRSVDPDGYRKPQVILSIPERPSLYS
jgi:hypothetical protein